MSSDHEAEIRASVGAHYELGARYDDAVAEGLVERIGVEIDKRIDARLGQLGAQAGSPPGRHATKGVPGYPVGPEAPTGQAVPLWPPPPPRFYPPPEVSLPPGASPTPGAYLPPGASGAAAPPGYYQVPPGYQAPGYPGYPGYYGYPGYQGYQGYQGPVPPGYPVPAPGVAPPAQSSTSRSVALTVTALGSMAF